MLGREKATKMCYIFIVVVFTIPAIFIMFYINKWDAFKTHFSWLKCPGNSTRYPHNKAANWSVLGPQPSSGSASVSWPSLE